VDVFIVVILYEEIKVHQNLKSTVQAHKAWNPGSHAKPGPLVGLLQL
jgi:hypothetical protein